MDLPTPPISNTAATEVSFQPFAFASTTGVFMLMGAVGSLYGPLLDSFSHRFHLSLASAGIAVSVYFVGGLVGVAPAWIGLKRLPGRFVLTFSLITMALGAAGAALSSAWIGFLASVFLIGVGFGGLDIGVNTLLARTAAKGRAARLSIGNAGYGAGAVICPLIIIAMHPNNFRYLFVGVALLAAVLATTNRGVHAPPLATEPLQLAISQMKAQRRPILITFIVAFIFDIALESAAPGWMATQLHGVGYTQSTGSLVTAGFWTGMTIGRALGGPISHRFTEKRIVLTCLSAAIVVCLLAYFDNVAPVAYPVLGLLLASMFPIGVIWYTKLCPHDSDGISLIILFLMIGGVAGPGLVSLMVSIFDVHVVPFVLAAYALAALGVFASALRFKPLVVTAL